MSNPTLPNAINQIRGLNTGTSKQLRYLFHNLSDKNKPSFTAKMSDSTERTLRLEAKYKQNETSANNTSTVKPELIGINLSFQELDFRKVKGDDNPLNRKSSLIFSGSENIINIPRDYNEKLHAVFVSGKNDMATLERFSEMIKRKEENTILETLQKFDDNIQGIKTLPDGIYFDIKNSAELIPSNIMGDGIRRFLNIVTAVSERKDTFVCIDEIENGLHYSAYKLLWNSLLSFSNLNNAQLFITTHNIETLICFKSVLEDEKFASMREYCKAFTVSRTVNAGYQAYRYSFEGFKDAIEHETEIRN
jgi:AAA15 family ATPase/GTPase